MPTNNQIEPWDKQPGEGIKRYTAFCVYRDLNPMERSAAKVAIKLGRTPRMIQTWCGEGNWCKRAEAWDVYKERIAREAKLEQTRKEHEAQVKEIAKMRKRHADLASSMLLKAARSLEQIPDDEIKMGDISRMVDIASKLERISRGDVGEVIEERDGGESIPVVQFYIPDNAREDG